MLLRSRVVLDDKGTGGGSSCNRVVKKRCRQTSHPEVMAPILANIPSRVLFQLSEKKHARRTRPLLY